MTNYFTLLSLAFDTNALKTTLYLLPSLFFLIFGLFLIIYMTWLDLTENQDPHKYRNGASGAILISIGLIFVIIGCFSIPQFHWLKLNFTSGQPIVSNIYQKKINDIEDNHDFVYNLMFGNFSYEYEKKQNLMNFIIQHTPKGVVIKQSDVQLLLQKNHLLYVHCMIDSKKRLLSNLQSKDITIPEVNQSIHHDMSTCLTFVIDDIEMSYLHLSKK